MNFGMSSLTVLCFLLYFYFREMFVENSFPETNVFFRFLKRYNQSLGFLFGMFGVILLFILLVNSALG